VLLPWPKAGSVYADDGPADREIFTIAGIQFLVFPTTQRGCDTGRTRFFVMCRTCGRVLHEATTGPTPTIEEHLREHRAMLSEALVALGKL
jgi:hypothetical protein